jgi:hypothetical protein
LSRLKFAELKYGDLAGELQKSDIGMDQCYLIKKINSLFPSNNDWLPVNFLFIFGRPGGPPWLALCLPCGTNKGAQTTHAVPGAVLSQRETFLSGQCFWVFLKSAITTGAHVLFPSLHTPRAPRTGSGKCLSHALAHSFW